MARKIAEATADLRTIAHNEFPHLDHDSLVSFGQVTHILHTVDQHRQKVENRRADSRNGWREVMLVQTIIVWVATVFLASMIMPGMVKYASVIPLAFDLAVTMWNKHRKV